MCVWNPAIALLVLFVLCNTLSHRIHQTQEIQIYKLSSHDMTTQMAATHLD